MLLGIETKRNKSTVVRCFNNDYFISGLRSASATATVTATASSLVQQSTLFTVPIGDVCPDGDSCRNNHRSRKKLSYSRDEETKLKIGKVDSLFTAVLK
mmetsp:Transcript_18714/g.20167  ORF Transcript_18714/g.20167 Transcript_18714/m.20167 type:complete len:99 (-) Transcript_18714:474-770(-)